MKRVLGGQDIPKHRKVVPFPLWALLLKAIIRQGFNPTKGMIQEKVDYRELGEAFLAFSFCYYFLCFGPKPGTGMLKGKS